MARWIGTTLVSRAASSLRVGKQRQARGTETRQTRQAGQNRAPRGCSVALTLGGTALDPGTNFGHIALGFALLLAAFGCGSDEASSPAASGGSGASTGTGGSGDTGSGGGPAGGAGTAGTAGVGPGGSGGQAGQGGTAGATGSGTIGMYEPCQNTAECLPGLHCQNSVPEPVGGQCTHGCSDPAECEAAPNGNDVVCSPDTQTCVIGCGLLGGECPPGLVCTDSQYCTESSTLVPTKNTGESCTTELECLNDAACVSGEFTAAYCSPPCTGDPDCKIGAPDAVGQCNGAGGLTFCLYLCGFMANGAPCPGDMTCEVAVCR